MKLCVVCPMGRDDGANLRANWERQRFQDARLVVVENGYGIGTCERHGVRTWAVLRSAQHQSAARNVGLEFALNDGATHWVGWDSDDIYGKHSLAEVAGAFADGHELVGKSDHYAVLSDGSLVFLGAEGENCSTPALQGPTLASVLWRDMPRFPDAPWGEDVAWTQAMVKAGKRPWATSRCNFAYSRLGSTSDHVMQLTDAQLLCWRAGATARVRCRSTDAVIDGEEQPTLEFFEQPAEPLWNHPIHRLSAEQLRAYEAIL